MNKNCKDCEFCSEYKEYLVCWVETDDEYIHYIEAETEDFAEVCDSYVPKGEQE